MIEIKNARKITACQMIIFFIVIVENPELPTCDVIAVIEKEHGKFAVGIRQANRYRLLWGLSISRGRPPKKDKQYFGSIRRTVKSIGILLLNIFLDNKCFFNGMINAIQDSIEISRFESPGLTLRLYEHKRITIEKLYKALFFAPLFGIESLSEFDYKKNSLREITGVNYKSAAVSRCLTELSEINAGVDMATALGDNCPSQYGYIDDHMVAFWTNKKMHKGKITMLGRVMSGTNVLTAMDEHGQAVYVENFQPDYHLVTIIVNYCKMMFISTGIDIFVIDRAANSLKLAKEFDSYNWGLLTMLDSNQYGGLKSFNTVKIEQKEDEVIYEGTWKDSRPDDNRKFVIVEDNEKVLVYWGNSRAYEKLDLKKWPAIYKKRNKLQENAFKIMKKYCALDKNTGNGKTEVIDRKMKKKQEKLSSKKENNQKKRDDFKQKIKETDRKIKENQEKINKNNKKSKKIVASVTKKLKSLYVKKNNYEKKIQKINASDNEINKNIKERGEIGTRYDRDLRKQHITAVRSLDLFNGLLSFLNALNSRMNCVIGIKLLYDLFFQRDGVVEEKPGYIIYYLDARDITGKYLNFLIEIQNSINEMGLNKGDKKVLLKILPDTG